MTSPSSDARREAAEALSVLDAEGARTLPALMQALNDEDPAVRVWAATGLGSMGEAAAPAKALLLARLRDASEAVFVRAQAAVALARVTPRDEECFKALCTAAHSPHPHLRRAVAQALARGGKPAVLPILESYHVFEGYPPDSLVWALRRLSDVTHDALADGLASPDPSMRARACRALGALRQDLEREAALLVPALGDESPEVRRAAIAALATQGQTCTRRVADVMVTSVGHRREGAARVLRLIGPEALPVLETALESSGPEARWLAARTIVQIRQEQTQKAIERGLEAVRQDGRSLVPRLIGELASPERAVSELARKVLVRVGAEVIPEVAEVLSHPEPLAREQAARALVELAPDSLSTASAILTTARGEKAILAASVLVRGGEPSIPLLTRILEEGPDAARTAAARALGALHPLPASALETLAESLATTDAAQFGAAFQSLQEAGERAVPSLLVAMEELTRLEEGRARARGLVGLANLVGLRGPAAAQAAPVLVELLEEPGEAVAEAAAEALSRIGRGALPALVAGLQTASPAAQALRVDVLVSMGGAASAHTPAMIEMIQDAPPPLEATLVRGLARLCRDDPGPLSRALSEGRPARCTRVLCRVLGLLGPSAAMATPVLLRLVETGAQEVRDAAMDTLMRLGPPGSRLLQSRLMDPRERPPTILIELAGEVALSSGTSREMAETLGALLSSTHTDTRTAAASALSILGEASSGAVPSLLDLARSPDPVLQGHGVRALTDLGVEILPALIASLEAGPPARRQAAAEQLGRLGPLAVPAMKPLIQMLESEDRETRVRVARILSQAARSKPEVLSEALGDVRPEARTLLLGALARMGVDGAPAAPALLRWLEGRSEPPPIAAVQALRAMGEEALEPLAPLTSSSRPDLRGMVLDVADSAAVLPPFLLQSLVRLLGDPSPRIRAAAVETFASRGPRAAGVLIDELREGSLQGRIGAAEALGRMAGAPAAALEPLIEATLDGSEELASSAEAALLAVARSRPGDLLPALGPDRPSAIRAAAARAAGQVMAGASRPGVLSPALLLCLEAREPQLRKEAIKALAQIRATPPATAERFLKLLEDPDADVATAARSALLETANHSLASLIEAFGAGDAEARAAAAHIVGWAGVDLGEKTARLAALLRDRSPAVRREAEQALPQVGARAGEYVLPLLVDEDEDVRWRAARVLGTLGPRALDHLPALLDLLRRKELPAREPVEEVCARLGPAAVGPLVSAMVQGGPPLRVSVARVLGRLGPEAAAGIPALTDLLGSPDATVYSQAFTALARVGRGDLEALAAGLEHPSPKVASSVAAVLQTLGPDALPAETALRDAAGDADRPAVAAAARETLTALGKLYEGGPGGGTAGRLVRPDQ